MIAGKKIQVLLADDHQMIIEGLRAVLQANDLIHVCGVANTGVAVLDLLNVQSADVVVLDINMPEMDGITCARKIKETYPQVKIIILTMYAQRSFIERILAIGVNGCLLKNNTGTELTDAILRVVSGKSYFDRIQSFREAESPIAGYKLSARELEIIGLIAEGKTSLQIAEKLFIAEHTVKTHRKNILRKTDVHNTGQLIQFAINNNLL